MPSLFYEVVEWWVSPYINHFLQPDTIIPNPANPQSLNRYSYVINNPIGFTDPTGHSWEECGDRYSGYRCKIHMNQVKRTKARWADESRWAEARMASARAAQVAFGQFQAAAAQYMTQAAAYSASSTFGGGAGIPCTDPGICGGTAFWHGGTSGQPVSDESSWFWDLVGNKYTPLGLAALQDIASDVQDVGVIIEGIGASTMDPALAALGGGIFLAGYGMGRLAGLAGVGVTFYQYKYNLNGTNGTDVYESLVTTAAGIYWPVSSKVAHFNTSYAVARLAGVPVPDLPVPFLPRE